MPKYIVTEQHVTEDTVYINTPASNRVPTIRRRYQGHVPFAGAVVIVKIRAPSRTPFSLPVGPRAGWSSWATS